MGSTKKRWGCALVGMGVLLFLSPFVIVAMVLMNYAYGGSLEMWSVVLWLGPVLGFTLVLAGFALLVWSR